MILIRPSSLPWRRLTAILAALWFAGNSLSAQGVAAPSAAKSVAKASIRLWKAELKGFPDWQLVVTSNGGKRPVSTTIAKGEGGYQFLDYVEVPAGRCTLEFTNGPASGAGRTAPRAVASLNAELLAETFFTVLVSEPEHPGEAPKLEVIKDGDRGEGKGPVQPTQVTVQNFISGLKDARVSVGEILTARFASNASYLRMRGFEAGSYLIHTTGTEPDGKPFEWTIEADFKLHPRQSLLIYPDYYGRIRPRLAVDAEKVSNPEPTSAEPR